MPEWPKGAVCKIAGVAYGGSNPPPPTHPPSRLPLMRVSEAILGRRNVRRFSDRPVDPDALTRAVDAARRAPSSMNEQRWDFVLVTERDLLRRLATLGGYADHVSGAGAAVALVTPHSDDPEERESIAFDLGQAAENLMLAAWEEGLGSCHATIDDLDGIRRLLGIPDSHRCELVISLGHPADPGVLSAPPRAGGRKPLADVLHRDRW
jgi:nitroreductase